MESYGKRDGIYQCHISKIGNPSCLCGCIGGGGGLNFHHMHTILAICVFYLHHLPDYNLQDFFIYSGHEDSTYEAPFIAHNLSNNMAYA